MEHHWTSIIVTCSNVTWGRILKKALTDLRDTGQCSSVTKETIILTAPDPVTNIGSGAATLNALFVVTEYLSAKKDYTVVTSDVLQNSRILILHHGRKYVYDSTGKGLIAIPACDTTDADAQTNLVRLVQLMSSLKDKSNNFGVWVCSTDASFVQNNAIVNTTEDFYQDCTLFCVDSDVQYAANHGAVVSDSEGTVREISYCASEEYLMAVAKQDRVQIISGIVYFPLPVAEELLYFHTVAPLNSCTYMGVDAGSEPLKLSLFFDILVAMISNISEESYLSGQYGNLYNVKAGLDHQAEQALLSARKVIWSRLSKFTLKTVMLHNLRHCYWDERLTAEQHKKNILGFGKTGLLQSFIRCEDNTSPNTMLAINTSIDCSNLNIKDNTLICNSIIRGGHISIGLNCLLLSVHIDATNDKAFVLPDNTCILGFKENDQTESRVHAVFGITDELHKNVDLEVDRYCGLLWKDFLKITNSNPSDIWNEEPKTLWNARLFAAPLNILFYAGILLQKYDRLSQPSWRDVQRFSLEQLIDHADVEKEVIWRQEIKSDVLCLQIAGSIQNNTNMFFLPLFRLAFSEGWHLKLLKTLDITAAKLHIRKFELCRTLSCIADLLGTMAGTMGRVRSGPGNNKAWIVAFDHLRNDESDKAITALKDMREEWLSSNNIIRAARHYESALQIFIQNAVKTAKTFLNVKSSSLPTIGQWVTAECPARVDLQGGWSDTPPICYEQGGSVVNVAILIDDHKPIGAKVRRTNTKTIKFILQNLDYTKELEVKSLQELADFNQVYADSALLKAAIVCAELIDLSSTQSLEEQLETFQSGFELQVWSHLPQGSGLGTSSILAGAIIAVLWTASGRTYTKRCIVHAVLYLEQLLTSGGGWQDQVGGIYGGVNRGYSDAAIPLEIKTDHIPISEHFLNVLNSHLFLIYTGKVRLAKNLLQNVIRNWYAREETIVKCFRELVVNSHITADAFRNEDLKIIGEQMNKYWMQKKILASGCEPADVHKLMKHLEDSTYGQLLVGAGGGGFMCILTKERSTKQDIFAKISKLPFVGNMTVHSARVDTIGLIVTLNDQHITIT